MKVWGTARSRRKKKTQGEHWDGGNENEWRRSPPAVDEPPDVVWWWTHTGEGLVVVRSLRDGGSTLEDQYGS